MSDEPAVIQPAKPALTHLQTENRRQWPVGRTVSITVLVLAAMVGLVWVFTLDTTTAVRDASVESIEPVEPVRRGRSEDDVQRAPYDALTFERAREKAQTTLRAFVEAQIQLTDNMQVDVWAPEDLRAANDLAKAGDQAFLEERFDDAYGLYADAKSAIDALLGKGEDEYQNHLAAGNEALAVRDTDEAAAQFASALIIKPESADAKHGAERADKLPEVISRLRDARNHELAERWSEARNAYDAVARLDPETSGLDALRSRTAQLENEAIVRKRLSDGFAALDAGRYQAARTAFRSALKIDPGNEVANGGLQQVASKSELGIISAKQREASDLEANEAWGEALAVYESVLKIDANIAFARDGKARMQTVTHSHNLLNQIKGNPDKLSSPKLYTEAQSIVREARDVAPGAPMFQALLGDVEGLLHAYANPVEVVLLSDAATDVLLSSVGRLGRFANKTLQLRPGEYTVVGSQDGCQDVRQNFIVKPDMAPITIRCNEFLNP